MLGEISQYSDVHHQQFNDYGSVQKLMKAFFDSMVESKNVPRRVDLLPIYDGTEYGANRHIISSLFESDIILTMDQLKGIILAEQRQENKRQKRKVITGIVYRWQTNRPIPYEFRGNNERKSSKKYEIFILKYSENWKKTIRSSLDFWEKETCLRWQENGWGNDRIIFVQGSGCYSSVGRTGGQQLISIGFGCDQKGIVTHEIGHSLGFWHEQSRADRDYYLRLQHKYIARGSEGNFVKRSIVESDNMGLPFDFGSIMLYGPNAFSNNWKHATIETINKNYQHTIGQRSGPSFIDVKQVNRLYCHGKPISFRHFDRSTATAYENQFFFLRANSINVFSDRCLTILSLPCRNGGYADPNNCQRCKCPSGLGGPICDDVQPSSCGRELIATETWQKLSHAGKEKCYWRIKTNNAKIRLHVELVSFRCEITCRSYIEIKHNWDFQQTGFRICCNEQMEVISDGNEVIVIFDATEVDRDGSFILLFIKGRENRPFRNIAGYGSGGPVERFILNFIPRVRDQRYPAISIASIVTDFTLERILSATELRKKNLLKIQTDTKTKEW
ncbi:unnamed protein product [Dracunculus medinensis]|uniref:Metalloendopeptidase n=1 Tax=Dracunculus medinensis TaxID=318479 RepID=A0A0N4UEL7_DRAME|nr:unnamed protein product [Dracunculus medinensis]